MTFTELLKTGKTVNLELVGLNGNAFSLMGAFRQQARREDWSKEELNAVLTECMSGDYDHLVVTLAKVCSSDEESEDDNEWTPYDMYHPDQI